MRRLFVVALVMLAAFGMSASCSKKSSPPPTAPPIEPVCNLNTTSLAFGTITVGSTADRSFTLTNTGGGTLAGTVSESSAEFSLVGQAAYSLGADQAATFTVRFAPSSAGAKACTLATGTSSCATVLAVGTGLPNTPICELTGTYLDFGDRAWSSSSRQSFYVRNIGGGLLWAVVRGARGGFVVDAADTSYVLDPGQGVPIHVTYTPSFAGTERCTLTVGENSGCPAVVLRGGGYLETHGFCSVAPTTPDTIDFGVVTIGQSVTRTYSITNGSTSYWAQGAVLNESQAFTLTSDPFFNMNPGSSQTGQITFTPTYAGVQYAAMAISCSEVGSGLTPGVQAYIKCRGTAVAGTPVRAPGLPASVRRVMRGLPTVGR